MSFLDWILRFLDHPVKIAMIAIIIGFAGLLTQGTLLDLWTLQAEKHRLEAKYTEIMKSNTGLEFRIEEAKNSDKFIGHQAREKLDLVREDELVFIFENDEDSTLTN